MQLADVQAKKTQLLVQEKEIEEQKRRQLTKEVEEQKVKEHAKIEKHRKICHNQINENKLLKEQ